LLALIVIFAGTAAGGTLGAVVSAMGKDVMEPGFAASEIDTSRPHPARMYDAHLGGKDNYPVDREAVRQVLRDFPEVRAIAVANRAFLQRAVRFLAGEARIRQFIDIGTGIPAAGNAHEVAGQVAPGALRCTWTTTVASRVVRTGAATGRPWPNCPMTGRGGLPGGGGRSG
jgi:hypothetical protein